MASVVWGRSGKRRLKNYNSERERMRQAAQALPPGTPVKWFGEPVGEVVGHTDEYRTKTTTGRDFNPTELTKVEAQQG